MTYAAGHSQIIGVGAFLPEQRITSQDLMEEIGSEQHFGVKRTWLEDSMGIFERRYADASTLPSDLATSAARHALRDAGIDAADIGAVVFTGIERDYTEPSTAHAIQANIGARDAKCVDITNACHGFMDGIHHVDMMIATGFTKYGLVVTGEKQSRVALGVIQELKGHHDRNLFKTKIGALSVGDAGGAMVMGPRYNGSGFLGFNFNSDGRHHKLCRYRFENGVVDGQMRMADICATFLRMQHDLYPSTLGHLGWKVEDISWLVQHQVGQTAFHRHEKITRVPLGRMTRTYPRYGNLTSATIPVNFAELVQDKRLQGGDKILIAGAGSGLTVSQSGYIW